MGYIVGLFLILGVVIYSFSSGGANMNILSNVQHTVGSVLGALQSKIYDTVFPKSESEILVDKLTSSNTLLTKFFNDSAPQLLKSKNISDKDKQTLQQAISTFNDSRVSLANIKNLESNDKGIIRSIIDKFIKPPETPMPDSIEPTSIPPQCKLVCGN